MCYVTNKKGNGVFSQLIQGLFQGGGYICMRIRSFLYSYAKTVFHS